MNAKRQTIWLVSMLSLMVVLSAYYLFTEDVNKLDLAATNSTTKPQEVKIDMSKIDPTSPSSDKGKGDGKGTAVLPSGAKTDAKVDAKADASKTNNAQNAPQSAPQNATKADVPKSGTAQNTAKTDDQILKQIEEQVKSTSAGDYFTAEQMKQHEMLTKKTTDLMVIMTDPKQSPTAVAQATNDLQKLSDISEKVENLEELLMKDFPQAIVSQDGNKWQVTVQSDKLEKSQGVTIVDLVMKELGATPEAIKVNYVRP